MTSYDDIFKSFLSKIEDFCLAKNIVERPNFVIEELTGWLKSAVSKTKRFINKTITFDDETKVITEVLDNLEVEVFALGMVVEWLRPRLYSVLNTNQFVGGKEEKFYSQANHTGTLSSLFKDSQIEIKKIQKPEFKNSGFFISNSK